VRGTTKGEEVSKLRAAIPTYLILLRNSSTSINLSLKEVFAELVGNSLLGTGTQTASTYGTSPKSDLPELPTRMQ
jgi:hypothetical protein